MKKSLLALFLCLVMLFGMIASSCGDSDGEEGESDKPRYTITLHTITGDSTTDEQIRLVQDEFNRITNSKFNTKVILKLYKESEYDSEIQKLIDNMHAKRDEEAEIEEYNRMMRDEMGAEGKDWKDVSPEPVKEVGEDDEIYPREKENQLDIFLVRSLKQYSTLVADEDILPLSDVMESSSAKLSTYVFPTLVRGTKISSLLGNLNYGVFNNTVLGNGEYKYLLLNKELMDKYQFDPETIQSQYENLREFLLEVKEGEEDVIPFLGDFPLPVEYFGEKGESVLGFFLSSYARKKFNSLSSIPKVEENGDIQLRNLLRTNSFIEWAENYNKLFQAGCIVKEADENAKFAAKIITGDVTLSPSYKDVYGNYKTDENGFSYITGEDGIDYYVSIYQRPIASNADVFGAGYVVSSFVGRNLGIDDENAVKRCMEIITAFNTDIELSNIFQYGVREKNYTFVDENAGVIRRLDDSYSMDIRYTGNIFLKYRSEDMDEFWTFNSKNKWENAKNSNLDSIFSCQLGYVNPEADEDYENVLPCDKTEEECIDYLCEISPEIIRDVLEFVDTEDTNFREHLADKANETDSLPELSAFTKLDREKSTTGKYYQRYNKWYQAHYNVKIGLG